MTAGSRFSLPHSHTHTYGRDWRLPSSCFSADPAPAKPIEPNGSEGPGTNVKAISRARWRVGMRALVVGGTGPTGPHIVAGLVSRGYDVTVFHRGFHELPELADVEHIHGDPHFRESIDESLGHPPLRRRGGHVWKGQAARRGPRRSVRAVRQHRRSTRLQRVFPHAPRPPAANPRYRSAPRGARPRQTILRSGSAAGSSRPKRRSSPTIHELRLSLPDDLWAQQPQTH